MPAIRTRPLLAVLVAFTLSTQVPIARAEIVDTDALATPSQVELERAKLQSFMDRANVKERFQALGVDGVLARDRVAALNEAEVHTLAQRIDGMPAGGALTTHDWILIGLVALLVLAVL